jgi:hypothetical protein
MKTKTKHVIRIDLAGRLVVAPALLIAPFVAIDRAAAQCDPLSPIINTTVTCRGTTTNQNGPNNGYGTDTDTGNTIKVLSGASVTGLIFGLRFKDGTVNNLGTITGTNGFGIAATDTATVFNSGTIAGSASGSGIVALNTANVSNSGIISAAASASTPPLPT